MKSRKPVDCRGRALKKGDTVLVKEIPLTLTSGLLKEDQDAILRCVGKTLRIAGFNNLAEAEVEFSDSPDHFHTIWVDGSALEKQE